MKPNEKTPMYVGIMTANPVDEALLEPLLVEFAMDRVAPSTAMPTPPVPIDRRCFPSDMDVETPLLETFSPKLVWLFPNPTFPETPEPVLI